jgi:hypothetical protein
MTSKDRNDGKCEYNRGCSNDVYKLPDYFESTILIVSSSNPTRSNTKCVNPKSMCSFITILIFWGVPTKEVDSAFLSILVVKNPAIIGG